MSKPYNDDADWKASAMTHDSLVVDILLHLKHTASRTICTGKLVAELSPAGWGAKQPRSGSGCISITTTVSGSKSVSECRRIGRIRRCSPSTPLSWSGGSGGGGGGDGCDTSSLPLNQSLSFRSKVCTFSFSISVLIYQFNLNCFQFDIRSLRYVSFKLFVRAEKPSLIRRLRRF